MALKKLLFNGTIFCLCIVSARAIIFNTYTQHRPVSDVTINNKSASALIVEDYISNQLISENWYVAGDGTTTVLPANVINPTQSTGGHTQIFKSNAVDVSQKQQIDHPEAYKVDKVVGDVTKYQINPQGSQFFQYPAELKAIVANYEHVMRIYGFVNGSATANTNVITIKYPSGSYTIITPDLNNAAHICVARPDDLTKCLFE